MFALVDWFVRQYFRYAIALGLYNLEIISVQIILNVIWVLIVARDSLRGYQTFNNIDLTLLVLWVVDN